jgi:hypothetical protein
MTLHFSQIGFTEGLTFIVITSRIFRNQAAFAAYLRAVMRPFATS